MFTLVKFVVFSLLSELKKIFHLLNLSVVKNHLIVLFITVNKSENKVLRLLISGGRRHVDNFISTYI